VKVRFSAEERVFCSISSGCAATTGLEKA